MNKKRGSRTKAKLTKAKLTKANPYLDSVKIEIEWPLQGPRSGSRQDVAQVIEEIRVLCAEWGFKYSLKETTGK